MSYEYLNTRLRIMRANLLGPQQFRSLFQSHDLDAFVNVLAETDYGPEIEMSSVEYEGYELVENALIRHTQRVFSKMYEIAFDEAKTLIRILLERFEVFNLKTILRGFHVGSEAEVIRRSLFPTILYPTEFYQDLLKREDISAIVDELLTVGNRYYRPVSRVYSEYEASGKLALLESALDQHYFGGSRQRLREIASPNAEYVERLLGREVDILNLVYALRVIEAGLETEEKYRYILGDGERLDEERVRKLLDSPDKGAFTRRLEETPYGRGLGEISEEITANEFQERLEGLLYRQNCRFDFRRPFDIHMAATLIWRLNAEETNLRVIGSGLAREAAKQEVADRLIWVEGMMPQQAEVSS